MFYYIYAKLLLSMKTMQLLVAFLMLQICQPVAAQSNFRKGFVIANGDTLRGLIDYRQWEKNPSTIKFKTDVNSANIVEYNTDDISYFEINGLDKYEKAVVNKDMRPVRLKDLTEDADDLYEEDTVFLRILVKGNMSLYQLTDDKSHFYIKADGKKFEELIYKVYLADGAISRRSVYIDQLSRFVDRSKNNSGLLSIIQSADYKENDLAKIVNQLNLEKGGEVLYTVKKLKVPLSFFVGAGAAYSSLKFGGESNKTSVLAYNKSIQPLLTAGIEMNILRNLQNLAFRAELSYFSMQFDGSGTITNSSITKQASYNLKVNTLSPSISALYNFLNSPKNKIYLGLAVAGNFSSYPQNIYREVADNTGQAWEKSPYSSLEKFWISTHAKAGWVLNKKIEICGSMKLDGSFSNFIFNSVSPSITSLSINYHLSK